jgi:hypothetical protein
VLLLKGHVLRVSVLWLSKKRHNYNGTMVMQKLMDIINGFSVQPSSLNSKREERKVSEVVFFINIS